MVKRLLKILQSNSFFLFGARGTGKTTLLREILPRDESLWIDLLNPAEEERYQLNPEILLGEIDVLEKKPCWIVIDEVQRAPKLLDIVHLIIERPQNKQAPIKFALTGSSARKLKRGAANLLAGRAFSYQLYPLTHLELENSFDLFAALQWGTLPFVINATHSREKRSFLTSYTETYLKEEVLQEQLIRNVVPFRKFLPIASQSSGTIVNYNKIAHDIGVDWSTVRNYFEILEDTLLGFNLPAYNRSLRKQQLSSPKFFLFDPGIKRALDRTLSIEQLTSQMIGPLFEQFVICEAHRLNHYLEKDFTFYYLTTQGGLEVDLIVERPGAPTAFIEIKSTDRVQEQHLRHLTAIVDGHENAQAFCFCLEKRPRQLGSVTVTPWQEGFKLIGLGQ